jgi:hypothetical protein
VHSGIGAAEGHELPAERDLGRAAEILNEGVRVAMLVGQVRSARTRRWRKWPSCFKRT